MAMDPIARHEGPMRAWPLLAVLVVFIAACSPGEGQVMRSHELSLAVSPEGAFAAWHGGPAKSSSIYLQRLDARGQLRGPPIRISDGPGLAYEPDLVWGAGELAVAWYERERRTGKLSAWLAAVATDGTRTWMAPLSAGGEQARNPVVRFDDRTLHVAWIEQERPDSAEAAIWYQRFSLAGTPIAPPVRVGQASGETWNLNAAVHDGAFIIVYDAALGTQAPELHMIAVRDGVPQHRRLSEDDGHASLYPDLQFSAAGHAALTWFDERDGNQEVYLLIADSAKIGSIGTSAARRISHTPDESIGAYLAWSGEVIGIAWSDSMGSRRDIFTQQFGADGRPIGPIYRLRSTAELAGVPAIHGRGDGFLIAWNGYVLRGDAAHMDVASSHARFAQVPISR
jgi:hypothetical protein